MSHDLLQRKRCACGGSCPRCHEKLPLQKKLAISEPGDQYEQEADRVADQVMRHSWGRPVTVHSVAGGAAVQRQSEADDEAPDPLTEGLGTVAENLGENNPAFSTFTESLAAQFLSQPPELSIGVPVFLGANYAFLWGMAMANPAMRRHFDDFNLAMLPGIVPQFPIKTFTYRILNEEQTQFEFDFGLDASALLQAFNEGVLNTHISTLSFESTGGLDTEAASPLSLSALQVNLGLFDDGLTLSGGFRSGVSPYPLVERNPLTGETSRIAEQVPPLPDLFPERQDVRFLLQLDVVRLYNYFNPDSPPIRSLPLELEGDVVDQPLQRKLQAADGRGGMAPAEAVEPVLSSPGQPLDRNTRRFMESRLRYDFSRVRVHNDAQATDAAQAVQARAFTVGVDMVFAEGEYAPETATGQRLLAHELTHVVQQSAASPLSAAGTAARKSVTPVTPAPQVQRACRADIPDRTSECDEESGLLTEPFFRFLVGCDNFLDDAERDRFNALLRRVVPGDVFQVRGFASEEGDFDINHRLSCARALLAASALERRGGIVTRRVAHGPQPGNRSDHRSVVVELLAVPGSQTSRAGSSSQTVNVAIFSFPGNARNSFEDLTFANRVYADCGVQFQSVGGGTVTASLLGADGILQHSGDCGAFSAEEENLVAEAEHAVGTAAQIWIFYLPSFEPQSDAKGLACTLSDRSGIPATMAPWIYIASDADPATLAHELGHLLIDSADHQGIDNPSDPGNVMVAPRMLTGGINIRIDATQCTLVVSNLGRLP